MLATQRTRRKDDVVNAFGGNKNRRTAPREHSVGTFSYLSRAAGAYATPEVDNVARVPVSLLPLTAYAAGLGNIFA